MAENFTFLFPVILTRVERFDNFFRSFNHQHFKRIRRPLEVARRVVIEYLLLFSGKQ
jgi:hypothetical protein